MYESKQELLDELRSVALTICSTYEYRYIATNRCAKGPYTSTFANLTNMFKEAARKSGLIVYTKLKYEDKQKFRKLLVHHVNEELGIQMPTSQTAEQVKYEIGRLIANKVPKCTRTGINACNICFECRSINLTKYSGTRNSIPHKLTEFYAQLSTLANQPTKEQPMTNLTLTEPVMVGGINILKASDEELVMLIRAAKTEIENNKDLEDISSKFRSKRDSLETIIKRCLKQLDK